MTDSYTSTLVAGFKRVWPKRELPSELKQLIKDGKKLQSEVAKLKARA